MDARGRLGVKNRKLAVTSLMTHTEQREKTKYCKGFNLKALPWWHTSSPQVTEDQMFNYVPMRDIAHSDYSSMVKTA